jgi:hypothetical protein
LWRASGQFALTWQIARQLESATVGTNSSVAVASSLLSIPLLWASQVNLLLLLALRVIVIGERGKIARSNNRSLRKKGEANIRATRPNPVFLIQIC